MDLPRRLLVARQRTESPLHRRYRDLREGGLWYPALLAGAESIYNQEPDEIAERMEKLTDLLTKLTRHIEDSKMTRKDKEKSKDLLNRIVLNVYEQKVEVKDEWANLEIVE